jgi:hypothetical protein
MQINPAPTATAGIITIRMWSKRDKSLIEGCVQGLRRIHWLSASGSGGRIEPRDMIGDEIIFPTI